MRGWPWGRGCAAPPKSPLPEWNRTSSLVGTDEKGVTPRQRTTGNGQEGALVAAISQWAQRIPGESLVGTALSAGWGQGDGDDGPGAGGGAQDPVCGPT